MKPGAKIIIVLFFFTTQISFSQTDSVSYSHDFDFNEGFYLSINQFKSNSPIPKQAIISPVPKGEPDFFKQVTEQKTLSYMDLEGKEQHLETANIWGYCQNRSVYVNFNNGFNKLNLIGTLCHFTSIIKINVGYPMSYNYGYNNTIEELRQFVLDTKNNRVYDFDVKNMEFLLSNDNDLSNQFAVLKKRIKSNSIFIYLRKYNEKHPFYLFVNK
jgi:hypothetical protein